MLCAQPLEERSHHFGTAETLETGTDVLMVPLQCTDLEDPVRGNRRNNKQKKKNSNTDHYIKYMCQSKHNMHSLIFSRHRLSSGQKTSRYAASSEQTIV